LVCERILKRKFPLEPISVSNISKMLRVVSHSAAKQDIGKQKVFIKRVSRNTTLRGGFDAQIIDDLLAGPKRDWVQQINEMLDAVYPQWRDSLSQSNRRLPTEIRAEWEKTDILARNRRDSLRVLIDWLAPGMTEEEAAQFEPKVDALLTMDTYILREILFNNYNFEKHESDFYDRLQLHYLADDRCVFVRRERRLLTYVTGSAQANRILNFDEYLSALESN
jgi:hypothetical protein